MKLIYWNIRGFANSPSRLALKNLIIQYKPSFVILSEPMMNITSVPRNWFARLNLKLFALNTRPNNLPNLWCFCDININPDVLNIDDQNVSFALTDNGSKFAIAAVYASTSNIKRKELEGTLNHLQTQYSLP